MEHQLFGPAETQYQDFSGTVALDDPDNTDTLYEMARINRDEWTIVGVSIYGGYRYTGGNLLAVRKDLVGKFEDWQRVAEEHGGAIPATRFELHETDDQRGVRLLQLFKRWSIHATARSALAAQGIDLAITETVGVEEDDTGGE